jgi:hypothetical protein
LVVKLTERRDSSREKARVESEIYWVGGLGYLLEGSSGIEMKEVLGWKGERGLMGGVNKLFGVVGEGDVMDIISNVHFAFL